ncbi:MAG: tripartite tricarboxylate transporter substrate binding protein [Burkholderiales bacterium]
MKRILIGIVTALAACSTQVVSGQSYPNKPIRLLVPFAPGGGSDVIARIAGQKLTEATGQQVIVENRPGAGGTLAAELGAKAPPDGYTLTLIAPSYTVGPSLYKLSFDAANDITAVIQLSQGAFILAVHPSLPVKTVKELIALAKARPDQMSYASAGAGSGIHLAMELFLDMGGIRIVHVPYKGNGPALTDTIAGNVQMLWGSAPSTLPQVKSGRLRAIAVSTAQRSSAAPDVPTAAEAGLKGYDVALWHGLIGPKGMPAPVVGRINGELNKALKTKEMSDRLAADGVVPAGGTPEQFTAIIRRDIERWGRMIRKVGVKAE